LGEIHFVFFVLGGAGGGSSISFGENTIYTTGHAQSTSHGFAWIQFYSKPTFLFTCTQQMQNLTVPAGVNYMFVDMTGASSGTGGSGGTPGYGARVQSHFHVIPGSHLYISVGCQGASSSTAPDVGTCCNPGELE
jgi:hypothetical protein